jgi:hypothetical protein
MWFQKPFSIAESVAHTGVAVVAQASTPFLYAIPFPPGFPDGCML